MSWNLKAELNPQRSVAANLLWDPLPDSPRHIWCRIGTFHKKCIAFKLVAVKKLLSGVSKLCIGWKYPKYRQIAAYFKILFTLLRNRWFRVAKIPFTRRWSLGAELWTEKTRRISYWLKPYVCTFTAIILLIMEEKIYKCLIDHTFTQFGEFKDGEGNEIEEECENYARQHF